MGKIVTTITASPGLDANTIVESTTDTGVEIRRVETQWATVIAPGAYDSPAPAYQIVSRVTTESTWEPVGAFDENGAPDSMPSTQLNRRTTTTEQLTGIPASIASGIPWPGGGYFSGSGHAALIEVEFLEELYNWGRADDPCAIQQATITRSQNYSPLVAPGGGAQLYSDGSYRADATYLFVEVSSDIVTYGPDGVGHSRLWRWHLTAPGVESYGEVPIGTAGSSIAAIAPIASTDQPARGSATIPQVRYEVVLAEYDATDASGYAHRTESPGLLAYPENEAELIAVAERRVIRDTSDTLDIPHRMLPFLRCGDHVAATNHARSLAKKDALVIKIKRTASVLNGSMRQVSTVRIPKLKRTV